MHRSSSQEDPGKSAHGTARMFYRPQTTKFGPQIAKGQYGPEQTAYEQIGMLS